MASVAPVVYLGNPRMQLLLIGNIVVLAREFQSATGEVFNIFAKNKKGATAESA